MNILLHPILKKRIFEAYPLLGKIEIREMIEMKLILIV
jgi:hypothetical protein